MDQALETGRCERCIQSGGGEADDGGDRDGEIGERCTKLRFRCVAKLREHQTQNLNIAENIGTMIASIGGSFGRQ